MSQLPFISKSIEKIMAKQLNNIYILVFLIPNRVGLENCTV